jgi:hypothetical protein
MTHVTELRKDQRPTKSSADETPGHVSKLPSASISPFLSKILGLRPSEES